MDDGLENNRSILLNLDDFSKQNHNIILSDEKKYAYLLVPDDSSEWEDTRIIFDKNIAIEMSKKYKNSHVEIFWFDKKTQNYLPLYCCYKNGIYIEQN